MRIDKDYNSLIKELNKRTKEYDEGHPTITDKEWDDLYFEIKKQELENNVISTDSPTQSISYEVVNELEKITHEHPMLSLPKTKSIEEVSNFIGDIPYIIMSKMDGLTCSLTYENGELVRAETRGNGEVGEDILHNAKILSSIPNHINYNSKLVIDGEIICKYNDFEEFSNEYANPRNFAAGSIRLLDSEECSKRKLSFIAWDLIEGFKNVDDLYIRLRLIEDLGFTIVPFIFDSMQTVEEEINDIKELSKELYYPIDGVVIKYRSCKKRESLPSTSHHAGGALAYKFYDDEYETKLKNIEWTMGRTGVLTPVAIFEPINIDGTVVERASLHNVSIKNETLHGHGWIGQHIKVIKANQIIPQINWAEEDDDTTKNYIKQPLICPICGEPLYECGTETITLNCENPKCDGKIINQFDHFCGKKGLDIKGLSKATLEKLIDWGWIETYEDLYKLKEHRAEWISKPGFGAKSVDNILSAIEESKTPKLESFISAIGIPLIGNTVSKELVKHVDSYEMFRDMIDNKEDFTKFDNIAEEKAKNILNFDYTDADAVYKYMNIAAPALKSAESESPQPLKDFNIVITGKLVEYKNRQELTDIITSLGGNVSSSVSSKTTLVVNNDINSTSAKNKKAKELGIPIISESELKEKYFN